MSLSMTVRSAGLGAVSARRKRAAIEPSVETMGAVTATLPPASAL